MEHNNNFIIIQFNASKLKAIEEEEEDKIESNQ